MQASTLVSLIILLTIALSSTALASETIIYKVDKLNPGKVLALRKYPTVHSRNIGKLSHNSKWLIKQKGRKTFKHSTWQKISWKGTPGWVKAQYLALDTEATKKALENPDCIDSTKRC